jgi:hypothetical protein
VASTLLRLYIRCRPCKSRRRQELQDYLDGCLNLLVINNDILTAEGTTLTKRIGDMT